METMAKTILIVEDDFNIADLLRLYLEKDGYTVHMAPDGGKGVELFRQVKPDLVLLDLMLPVLDGWGVLRSIRAESDCPVIMLTAKGCLLYTSTTVFGKNSLVMDINVVDDCDNGVVRRLAVCQRSLPGGRTADDHDNLPLARADGVDADDGRALRCV